MSGLTPCNYCTLQMIEREAKARGATVDCHRMTLAEENSMDIRPPYDGREYRTWYLVRESDATEPIAMFKELTASCVC